MQAEFTYVFIFSSVKLITKHYGIACISSRFTTMAYYYYYWKIEIKQIDH